MRVLGEWKGLKWRNSKKSFAPRQRKAVLCMQGHSKAAAVAVAHKGGPPYPIQHKAISDLRSYPVSYVTAICFMQRRTQVNGSWFTFSSSWKFSHGRTEIQKCMKTWVFEIVELKSEVSLDLQVTVWPQSQSRCRSISSIALLLPW